MQQYRLFVLGLVLPVLVACTRTEEPTPAADVSGPSVVDELTALYREFDEEHLALHPIDASFRGDYRYNDRWYPSDPLSDEFAEASHELHSRYLERLLEIDPSNLQGQDRLSYDVFRLDRENAIERHDLGIDAMERLTPVDQLFSMPTVLAILGAGGSAQPFSTADDYDDWISRSKGFAGYADLAIARMREGVERGIVQPTIVMEKALPQLAAQVVDDPEQSVFWRPVANMPETIPAEDRRRIEDSYRAHISEVLVPAYAKLRDYVEKEYLPHTRASVGLSDVPGGPERYAFLVREMTTTTLTAEEIHAIGRQEAARLYAEMEKVKEQTGFDGDMAAFFEFLNTDPQFFFDDRQSLVDAYDALRDRINPRLDTLFDIRPATDYVVRAIEEFREQATPAAHYSAGTPDGSRPGVFYVNTYDLGARPKWLMEALSIHEASPGHHFQVSIAQELDELPAFRRFGSYTAYAEGWGLYAESLGRELGLYTDPYQYFGSLYSDIWRANRLVVDTGLHALGWSREQAIDWMRSNSPVSEADVIAEVDRYIAMPAQALAYKIGQLEIRKLRDRAEDALGDDFDVREFHNRILTSGALPLVVLEHHVDRWIADQAI